MLKGEDSYREKLLGIAQAEGFLLDTSAEQFARCTSRDETGLSSLNAILLISAYIEQRSPGLEFDAAWVPSLETVDGMAAVMREIDECAGVSAG